MGRGKTRQPDAVLAARPLPPPALDQQDRENQLIALAVREAERRILDGSASDTLLAMYIREGLMRASIEKEKLKHEIELIDAKKSANEMQKANEELYKEAIDKFTRYGGSRSEVIIYD